MREEFSRAEQLLSDCLMECRKAAHSPTEDERTAAVDDSLTATRFLVDTFRGQGRQGEAQGMIAATFRAYFGRDHLEPSDVDMDQPPAVIRNLFMFQLKRGSILEELGAPDSALAAYLVAYDLSRPWAQRSIVNPRWRAYGQALLGRAAARTGQLERGHKYITDAESYVRSASVDPLAAGWMRATTQRIRVEYWIAVGGLRGFASAEEWERAATLADDTVTLMRSNADRRELRKAERDRACIQELKHAIGRPGGRCSASTHG
jgi:hypothetical protein